MFKLYKYAYNFVNAFRAGLIANRCELCVVDNVEEEIRPCLIHEREIMRLYAKQKD